MVSVSGVVMSERVGMGVAFTLMQHFFSMDQR